MFDQAYRDRGLAPELEPNLEDAGTVTSVLIHGIRVVLINREC